MTKFQLNINGWLLKELQNIVKNKSINEAIVELIENRIVKEMHENGHILSPYTSPEDCGVYAVRKMSGRECIYDCNNEELSHHLDNDGNCCLMCIDLSNCQYYCYKIDKLRK